MKNKQPSHAATPPSHTKTPWIHSENHPTDIIDEHGDFIGRCLRSENAAFIVRAVNSHEVLLSALKAIKARINGVFDDPNLVKFGSLHTDIQKDIIGIAYQAILQAEAQS